MSYRIVTRRGRARTRIAVLATTISLMAFAQALASTPAAAVDDVGNDACTDAIYLVDCTAADDSDDGGLSGTDGTSSGGWDVWVSGSGGTAGSGGGAGGDDAGPSTDDPGSYVEPDDPGLHDDGGDGDPGGDKDPGDVNLWDTWLKGSGDEGMEALPIPPAAFHLPRECWSLFYRWLRVPDAEEHAAWLDLQRCKEVVNQDKGSGPTARADIHHHPLRKARGRQHGRARHVRVSRNARSLHTH